MSRSLRCALGYALAAILLQASALDALDEYPVPDYGRIGVFADMAGTSACIEVPRDGFGTLYLLATPSGPTEQGVTGVELRIEVEHPEGWRFYFEPPQGTIVLGRLFDTTPGDTASGGANISFSTCVEPDSATGKVCFGTVRACNDGGSPTALWVRRHSRPPNPGFDCALLVDCREEYIKWCTVAQIAGACTGPGEVSMPVQDCERDPVLSVAAINKGVEPPPVPRHLRPSHPEREVLAMLQRRTLVEFPPERSWAPIEEVQIRSPAVQEVVLRHRVELVAKGMPCFDLADTLCGSPEHPVRCTDWTLLFVFQLPLGGSSGALARDLSACPDVVYAEPNGFVVPDDVLPSPSFSFPNPLRPGARMTLELAAPSRVLVEIYDARGRYVRRLLDQVVGSGTKALSWDGKDDVGNDVPSGVYLVRYAGPAGPSTRKAVLLR